MTMKTTTNTGKIQKYSRKVREESVEAISNKLFYENCMYDPRNLFFKINANIKCVKIQKGTIITKKIPIFLKLWKIVHRTHNTYS